MSLIPRRIGLFYRPPEIVFPLDILREKGYTITMEVENLTTRQLEIAIALREGIFGTEDNGKLAGGDPDKLSEHSSWGAMTDLLRVIATVIEGAEDLLNPREMDKRFKAAWMTYARLYKSEHHRMMRDCLGGQAEFDRVNSHPNGHNALCRIMERILRTHGELKPGMVVDVEVGDILLEELGDVDCNGDNSGETA